MNEFDLAIIEWSNASQELKKLKVKEAFLRQRVLEVAFDSRTGEGVQTLELGNGYSLKACFKLSFGPGENFGEVLNELEGLGHDGLEAANKLLKWKPEFSTTEYKNLSPEMVKIVQKGIVVKSTFPSLELIAPKA